MMIKKVWVMRVDIWSDVVCPFCYIGKKRLEHAAQEAGITLDIHWHSFELDPHAPRQHDTSNTVRLAEKYGRTIAETEEMERRIAEMAKEEGIDFQWQKANSGNTFDAHRLLHLAEEQGMGSTLKEAFLHAYMTEGALIGEQDVVEKIAIQAGLDVDKVKEVLASDLYAGDVRHDEATAQQLQISAVPFFIFDKKLGVSGAQPKEIFKQAFEQTLAEEQNISGLQCDEEQCDMPKQ